MTFSETICRAAEEGAVLLKNEECLLPFTSQDNVAVFGRCQKDWYRSGTGSGGSVHVSYTTTLIESLLELSLSDGSMPHIDVMLAKTYSNWIQENPYDNGGGAWGAEPWCQKEMPLSKATFTFGDGQPWTMAR